MIKENIEYSISNKEFPIQKNKSADPSQYSMFNFQSKKDLSRKGAKDAKKNISKKVLTS